MNTSTLRTGLVFALLQLFFTLTWTVYVIYLPRLAAEAGIAKSWIVWILIADQLVFLVTDWLMGVKADRSARIVGKLGSQIGLITLVVATTAAFAEHSRIWKVTFHDAATPALGGTIERVLEGPSDTAAGPHRSDSRPATGAVRAVAVSAAVARAAASRSFFIGCLP